MKMRIQWGKMGFSRRTRFTIRCATKTEAPANIIKQTTPRESISTRENITCDFPLFPMHVLTNVILRLGRETKVNSYYFILSHIEQSQSECIGSCDE